MVSNREREVPWSEIKKGYEITKNNYVILEKEDLENIKLKTTHTIEINEFIDSEDFNPLFIEKNYYIGPDSGATKKEEKYIPFHKQSIFSIYQDSQRD